jgi:predicted nucleic acid-binding protein
MLVADTNIFIQAADPHSVSHSEAIRFMESISVSDEQFVVCELVLVELYLQLRNPAIFKKAAYAPSQAANFCAELRENPAWRHIDYDPLVSTKLWKWATETTTGFGDIIDARLALTLRHHGVTRFATVNVKHFQNFGFTEVWNPLLS